MFENLREAEKHYEEIAEQLMNPDVVSDTEKFKSLMKEHKTSRPSSKPTVPTVRPRTTLPVPKSFSTKAALTRT